MTGSRRFLVLGATAAFTAMLGGCGAGDPTYYTLAAEPGPARGGGPGVVEVRTPTVASSLDRDYIVSRTSDYALELAGNRAWAEPLGQMIGRILASDLAARLPGSNVYAEGDAAAATPDAVISLDIGRFDKDASGTVVVAGSLAVRAAESGDGTASNGVLQRFRLSDPASGAGTTALVATLSRLLGELADRAAEQARAIAPSPARPVPLAAAEGGVRG